MDHDDHPSVEGALRRRLDAMGPATRDEILRVLSLSEAERADRIGALYAHPRYRALAEMLIDLEVDATARAIAVVELRIRKREHR